MGSIVAHEITHGFDDEGRQYDFNGDLVNWWSPKIEQQFLKKAKCIIDQYNHYIDPRTKLKVKPRNFNIYKKAND